MLESPKKVNERTTNNKQRTNEQTPEVSATSAPSWDWDWDWAGTGTGTGTGVELSNNTSVKLFALSII